MRLTPPMNKFVRSHTDCTGCEVYLDFHSDHCFELNCLLGFIAGRRLLQCTPFSEHCGKAISVYIGGDSTIDHDRSELRIETLFSFPSCKFQENFWIRQVHLLHMCTSIKTVTIHLYTVCMLISSLYLTSFAFQFLVLTHRTPASSLM